jgi:hypothetical protein
MAGGKDATEANLFPGRGSLRRVGLLEQFSDRNDWGERQKLSTAFAILGRQPEARAIPLFPDAVGHELSEAPDTPKSEPLLTVTPWRGSFRTVPPAPTRQFASGVSTGRSVLMQTSN